MYKKNEHQIKKVDQWSKGEGYPVDGHGLSWSGSHASTVSRHSLVRRGGTATHIRTCKMFLLGFSLFHASVPALQSMSFSRLCVCVCGCVCVCVWVYMCTCVLIQHVRLNMDSFHEMWFHFWRARVGSAFSAAISKIQAGKRCIEILLSLPKAVSLKVKGPLYHTASSWSSGSRMIWKHL